ncbi:hypothetical protein HDZ31DRAFT_8849, partial [Schizophyllum fasciatum]
MVPVTVKSAVQSTSAVKKTKKPPACDYCKARRVICHPQPDGKPCPRCVEKEVTCTTTPVVRRKPRRRAGDGADQRGSALAPSAAPTASSSSSSRTGARRSAKGDSPPGLLPSPHSSLLSWRDAHPLPATFIEELIKLFPSVPQYKLPIVPFRKICTRLEACAWDLSRLHPHECVLAYSIMAVTARVSTHPMLIGADVSDTQLLQFLASGNVMITPGLDLRELGRRRDALCRRLQDEACRLAFEAGVTVVTSEENAASCYLLDFLESSTNSLDNPMTWTAAMMWHMRTLAESEDRGELFSVNYCRLHWPIQLMNCALLSLCSGRSIPFTEHDERLICGPPPVDIETATITLANQPVTDQTIGNFIYPFLSHVIHLARQSSENIIGPYARRFPLNEAALIAHIAAIEALQKTSVFLHDCIELALPTTKRDWARPALKNGLFITGLAAPSLLIPLHRELRRRLAEGSVSVLYRGDEYSIDEGFHVDEYASRARGRVEALHRRVRAMALRSVAEATRRTPHLPSLAYMTHLQCSRFGAWIDLFVRECEPADIAPGERYMTLERMGAIIKLDGFAWVDRSGSVSTIEGEMALLQAQQQLVPHFAHGGLWADDVAEHGVHDVAERGLYDDLSFRARPERDDDDREQHYDRDWSLTMPNKSELERASISPDFPATGPSLPNMMDDSTSMLDPALPRFTFPLNFPS